MSIIEIQNQKYTKQATLSVIIVVS